MTFVHVLNFSIPIGFMVFFGYLLDRACKPAKVEEKAGDE